MELGVALSRPELRWAGSRGERPGRRAGRCDEGPGRGAKGRGGLAGTGDRRGFALVATMFVLLALALLTPALVFVCRQTAAGSSDAAEGLRARLAARSGIHLALSAWDEGVAGEIGLAERLDLLEDSLSDGSRFAVEVERLEGDRFLLRSTGWRERGGARTAVSRIGFVLLSMPPERYLEGLDAALVAGGSVHLRAGGAIEAGSGDSCASAGGAPAPDGAPGLVIADLDALLWEPGGELTGDPPLVEDPVAALVRGLGRLGWADLVALAERVEGGAVAPAPAAPGGVCDAGAPGNWGAPLEPSHPCSGLYQIIHAPGDLSVGAGAGQGILLVEGDLVLAEGVYFSGIVLVRGSLTLASDARLVGSHRVHGEETVVDGRIARDRCAALAALAARPLAGPLRPPGRAWIPLY